MFELAPVIAFVTGTINQLLTGTSYVNSRKKTFLILWHHADHRISNKNFGDSRSQSQISTK